MSAAARIDDLKKRYNENPRRFFAPLANEYRKAGDFEQAIGLCQAHLPDQPMNMNGHVVLGQALFDSGRSAEARTVFETALALDPENLISLRRLGDIAFARGDRGEARRRYARVLESDTRNPEIIALLTELGPEPAVDPGAPGHEHVQPEQSEAPRGDVARSPLGTAAVPGRTGTPPVPVRRATPAFSTPVMAQLAVPDTASRPNVGLLDLSINLDAAEGDAFGIDAGDIPANLHAFGDVTINEPDAPEPRDALGDSAATAERDVADVAAPDEAGSVAEAAGVGDVDRSVTEIDYTEFAASALTGAESGVPGFAAAEIAAPDFADPEAAGTSFVAPPTSDAEAGDGQAPRWTGQGEVPPLEPRDEPEAHVFDVNEAFADLDSAFEEHVASPASALGPDSNEVLGGGLDPSAEIDLEPPDVAMVHDSAPDVAPSEALDDQPGDAPSDDFTMGEDGPEQFVRMELDTPAFAASENGLTEAAPDDGAFDAHSFGLGEPFASDESSMLDASHGNDIESFPSYDDALAVTSDDAPGSAVEPPRAFVTMTMAELYLQQGFREEALGVYRELATQHPDDEELKQRTRELENAIREAADRDAAAREDPQAALAPPAISHGVARSNRSARDFFGVLAARRGRRQTALQGPEANDTVTFSTVHPPIETQPTGPDGSLDALFGNRDVATVDEDAARAFAGVAGGIEGPERGVALGQDAGPGSGDLALASVFDSVRSAGGGAGIIPRQSEKLRFDQFFSSAPQLADHPPASSGEDASSGPPACEPGSHAELEQFRDWLQQFRQP